MSKIERTMAGDIPVFCAYDEIVPLEKIIPNPKNSNDHPTKQITLLSKIIKEQGWRNPITISNRSGFIVKGHGRLFAAREGEMEYAPVEYQNYDTEAAEFADMIADNRIAELAETNEEMLHDLLSELADTDIDLALTGYDGEDLDAILADLSEETEEEEEDVEEDKKELPRIPLSRSGDRWLMGAHAIDVGPTTGDDLILIDVLVGHYIEYTGNISVICVRDGREIPYMDLIREWAETYDCVEILAEQKVPVIKFKK